jgi:hypothetical protein
MLVERALEAPACRFLRHLEVDPASFGTGLRAAHDVEALLELFATRATVGPLESVRIGPVGLAVLPEVLKARWTEARARFPRLSTPLERLLYSTSQATLEVLSVPEGVSARPAPGRSIGLSALHPNFIGQLDECAVFLSADVEHPASRLALRVEAEGPRWFVEDIAGLARARPALCAPARRRRARAAAGPRAALPRPVTPPVCRGHDEASPSGGTMPTETFDGWLQRLENLIRLAGVTESIDRDAAFMAYDMEGKTAGDGE